MHYKQKDNLSFNSRIYSHELVYSAKIFHLAQALISANESLIPM